MPHPGDTNRLLILTSVATVMLAATFMVSGASAATRPGSKAHNARASR